MSQRKSGEIAEASHAPETVDVNSPAVLWGDFRTALRAITLLGIGPSPTPPAMGRHALFYPPVGLLIGAALLGLDRLFVVFFSQEVTNVFLVAALAILSAGRHLDGFGNTADAMIGFRTREDALATMHDRPVGTFGTAAIFFLLILKIRGFDLLAEEGRLFGLLLAPMMGRWAMVVLAHGSREAALPGAGGRFARDVGWREFAVASVFAFAVVLSMAEALGLLVAIAVAVLTIALRIYFHRRLGGITGQSLGAVTEAAETLALILFALTG